MWWFGEIRSPDSGCVRMLSHVVVSSVVIGNNANLSLRGIRKPARHAAFISP